jgi:hypothetical protein
VSATPLLLPLPLPLLPGALDTTVMVLAVAPGKPLLARLPVRVLAKAEEVVAAATLASELPRGAVTWGGGGVKVVCVCVCVCVCVYACARARAYV